MGRHIKLTSAIAVVLLLVLVWWLARPQPVATEVSQDVSATSDGKRRQPHFPSRSASNAPMPADSQRVLPDQEAVELVYPEGVLLTCPAPGLSDGPYRVSGSALRHLRIEDGVLVGALAKPSEGRGFLLTQRGHHVAEFQWSERGCQLEPLVPLTLLGVVVDPEGEPVADVEVVGCVGDLMKSGEDGSFGMTILSGQTCWAFAFREDEEGFAKGSMVEVVGGETEDLELQVAGASIPASEQRELLQQGAHQVMSLLERAHAAQSPVDVALEQHPDNLVLQAWSDDEINWLNLRYEDVEYLLSGNANEEDWREGWLFGFGM